MKFWEKTKSWNEVARNVNWYLFKKRRSSYMSVSNPSLKVVRNLSYGDDLCLQNWQRKKKKKRAASTIELECSQTSPENTSSVCYFQITPAENLWTLLEPWAAYIQNLAYDLVMSICDLILKLSSITLCAGLAALEPNAMKHRWTRQWFKNLEGIELWYTW